MCLFTYSFKKILKCIRQRMMKIILGSSMKRHNYSDFVVKLIHLWVQKEPSFDTTEISIYFSIDWLTESISELVTPIYENPLGTHKSHWNCHNINKLFINNKLHLFKTASFSCYWVWFCKNQIHMNVVLIVSMSML